MLRFLCKKEGALASTEAVTWAAATRGLAADRAVVDCDCGGACWGTICATHHYRYNRLRWIMGPDAQQAESAQAMT